MSWFQAFQQLINNTGGLYNRVTHPFYLESFTLAECEAFFKDKITSYDRYHILQLYMVFGGIPIYLNDIDPVKMLSDFQEPKDSRVIFLQ